MSETERKVDLWLTRGQPLTRNDLADFLCEVDAAGAAGDTVIEVRTHWLSGAVRGLFTTVVTRGDPVPHPDARSDWDALAAGDDSRPPYPGRPGDWYGPLSPARDRQMWIDGRAPAGKDPFGPQAPPPMVHPTMVPDGLDPDTRWWSE